MQAVQGPRRVPTSYMHICKVALWVVCNRFLVSPDSLRGQKMALMARCPQLTSVFQKTDPNAVAAYQSGLLVSCRSSTDLGTYVCT